MKILITSLAILSSSILFAQESAKVDSAQTKKIDEVVMTKRVFEKKADRLVFDVANSPIAKGNTAFGLLKETPLVSSTDDKNLKIAGKSNAVIYINGRKSNMNPEALEAFLKNTPAENIQKIEVITLPGSEFNVESSDGIINIILKKKQSDGVSGNLSMRNTQAKYNSQNASGSLNFRKNKLAITANVNSRNNVNLQDYILTNGDAVSSNTSVGYVSKTGLNLGGYINVDYELSDKQTVGLSYNNWFSESNDGTSYLFNTVKSVNKNNVWETNYNLSQNAMRYHDLNNSLNFNYELKTDDEGSKLNLNAAYLIYRQTQRTDNETNNTDANNNITSLQSKFFQYIPQKINNFSSTADYVKVFKNFKVGIGGNYNQTKTDNDTTFEVFNAATGEYVKVDNQSNHFVYDEKISGFYANIEKSFGEKFSAKLGARIEFTNSLGEIIDSDINIKRNYNNILPTLSLNYNINANNSLSYGFTSRVERPSFWEINPEKVYLTKVNYIQNNPFMKSSSVYNQELMYMYKNAYFLQITDSYTQDATTQVPLQKTVNGVSELRYIRTNYGSENNFAVNLGMNKSFFKQIWNVNYVLGMQINSYKGSVDKDPVTNETFEPYKVDGSLVTPFFQAQNNIRLSANKDWYLGINYFYLGKNKIDLGILKPLQQLDVNIKKIWNNWTFSLDLYDILKTNRVKIYDVQESGKFNGIDQYQYSRKATLGIVYNFGNQKIKKARKVEGAANDIKNRTGN